MGRRRRAHDARLIVVGFVLVAALLGLGYRLFQVQAVEAQVYAADGADQRVRHEDLPATRGTIYDRDGVELAVTVDAPTLIANPSQVANPAKTARVLAPIVRVDEATLLSRLSSGSQFAYVGRSLDKELADAAERAIDEHALTGLYFTTEPKRTYPAGSLASSLIGFVRTDSQEGLEGLEFAFDEELTGTPGTQIVERDAFGTPIPQAELLIEPAVPGADVVLTIDREIQYAAEQALLAGIARSNAAAGSVVVLDVQDGEILAMASLPGFDPADRGGVEPDVYRNRAISDVYEPGSTIKAVTVAAALNEGVITPGTLFDVPAELLIHEKNYTDVGRKQSESMNVAQIVARSSNIGTILIQEELGNQLHYDYLKRFGFGSSTGTDLPAEATGVVHPVASWCPTTCGPSTAIGYSVDVTPLQMAAAFAALANDGVWIEPHVVREVIDGAGNRTTPDRVERPVISAETAETMLLLLRGVVETGTGWRAAIDGYAIGGKTGTTEKVIPGVGYSETDVIASFIGIAPIDDPEIVIAVVLDSPHGEVAEGDDEPVELAFGGVSAAPVFAEVAEAALHQLGIAPRGG
jgi:cell division protein FtsI (penicillin-binding protein 3)